MKKFANLSIKIMLAIAGVVYSDSALFSQSYDIVSNEINEDKAAMDLDNDQDWTGGPLRIGYIHLDANNDAWTGLWQINPTSSNGDYDFGGIAIVPSTSANKPVAMEASGLYVGSSVTAPSEALEVYPGSNKAGIIGVSQIGYVGGYSGWAGFSHKSSNASGEYALLQNSSGKTLLNAASGERVEFRINNSSIATYSAGGFNNILFENHEGSGAAGEDNAAFSVVEGAFFYDSNWGRSTDGNGTDSYYGRYFSETDGDQYMGGLSIYTANKDRSGNAFGWEHLLTTGNMYALNAQFHSTTISNENMNEEALIVTRHDDDATSLFSVGESDEFYGSANSYGGAVVLSKNRAITFSTQNNDFASVDRADFHIDNGGNIGIGTSDPSFQLDIYDEGAQMRLYNRDNTDAARLQVGANGGSHIEIIANSKTTSYYGIPSGNAGINGLGDIYFATGGETNGTTHMILNTDGEVGLGTSTPAAQFHIQHTGDIELANSETGSLMIGDNASHNLVMDKNEIMARNGVAASTLYMQHEGGDIAIGQNATTTGNTTKVGINCAPMDGYTLAVDGTIRAKNIELTYDNWPDYVFEKDYKKMTLDEVENFIAQHGHLPKVKSAKEVEKNGLSVVESNKVMMEKIEEMTLYMIELQNRIKQLEARN